jgi:hypothetical protein
MNCPRLNDCPLFPEFTSDHMRKFWIVRYCTAGYDGCARLRLATRGEPVPATLLPNGKDLRAAVEA